MSSSNTQPLKVGIVDDSALIRQILREVITDAPNMEVVGEAEDPYEAREMIKRSDPDVITLDIEMPKMNGIEFLEKIMRLRPMPVIMVSTLTQKGAAVTVRALEIGAMDYVAKPENQNDAQSVLSVMRDELIPKLGNVRSANFATPNILSASDKSGVIEAPQKTNRNYDVIAIASSTGGVERLRYLISNINVNIPPVVIVQHINNRYVSNLIERNQDIAPDHIKVQAAENQRILKHNTIYFADNTQHVTLRQAKNKFQVILVDEPPCNGFVASADYLFDSMAKFEDAKILGLVLSGMGNDGAKGLLNIRKAGAETIGENKSSCLVYGMSNAAMSLGAVQKEESIQDILKIINNEKRVL